VLLPVLVFVVVTLLVSGSVLAVTYLRGSTADRRIGERLREVQITGVEEATESSTVVRKAIESPLPAIENGGSAKTTPTTGWAMASGGREPNVNTSRSCSSVASTRVSLASGPGRGRTHAAGLPVEVGDADGAEATDGLGVGVAGTRLEAGPVGEAVDGEVGVVPSS
jgi:hypothetical protein